MTQTLARAHRWAPAYERTNGDIAAHVGEQLGLAPDAEQRWLLDGIFAETPAGLPVAFQSCVIAPRQNMKSAALAVAAMTDLFVFKVPLHTWTAHEFDTSQKSFEDMVRRIEGNDDFRRRCRKPRTAHGDECIELLTGERIEFRARTGSAGRGVTGTRLTLDEGLYLRPKDMGALIPTLVTKREAQVRVGSSAGFAASAVLRRLRDRGRRGDDPRLVYVEYGAERRPCTADVCTHELDVEGCALDDRELWWQSNIALHAGRITEESLEDSRRSMPPREFAREFLTWWEEPDTESVGVFDSLWLGLADPEAERGKTPAFGISVAPDRSWSAVAVAWRREDGHIQVMLADYRPSTDWLESRVQDLRSTWRGTVVASTSARGVIPGAIEPSQGEQAQAHSRLDDAVHAGTVRHGNQAALNTSVRAARWKPYGDTRMLDRKGNADISPLDAAALAVFGVTTTPNLQPGFFTLSDLAGDNE